MSTTTQQTIKMPKLGLTMTEATLSRWLKAEGDSVTAGEILFEFESDKSLLEYESPAGGVLSRQLVAAGETVPTGTPVALLDAAAATSINATPAARRAARTLGVDLSQISGRGPNGRIHRTDVETNVEAVEIVEANVEAAASTAAPAEHQTGTPLAKRLAGEMGVDWRELAGSGSGGRVVKADVLQAAAESPLPGQSTPPPDSLVADAAAPEIAATQTLDGTREIIARRMQESTFSAPHVTLFSEADATALVEARQQLNSELNDGLKISYNCLLIAMLARLLSHHPPLNACLVDDEIRYYKNINIALAIDTERGLLAPVIRNADQLSVVDIQHTINRLITEAQTGSIAPAELSGGTFTLTNLGQFEIDGFTPIINQPQAAILGVGRIAAKAVVAADGSLVARQMMTLSLSFDHRIVDGGPAARFLQRLKQLIERPFALLLRA